MVMMMMMMMVQKLPDPPSQVCDTSQNHFSGREPKDTYNHTQSLTLSLSLSLTTVIIVMIGIHHKSIR